MHHFRDEAQRDKVTGPRSLSQLTEEWDYHLLPIQCSFFSHHSEFPIHLYSNIISQKSVGHSCKDKIFLLLNTQHIITLTFQKLSF